MSACCSTFEGAADQQFNERKVAKELAHFRAKGPGPSTRLLERGITDAGALGGVVLDVGAGFGALTFRLLDRGMSGAIAVDASAASTRAAQEEAERRDAHSPCTSCAEISSTSRSIFRGRQSSPSTGSSVAIRPAKLYWTRRSVAPTAVGRCRTLATCGTCGSA